ncbi:Dehydrodolichyl diphosphate synthase 7 [Morella rubra]|uniref:Dehydrodolichyl diphosphate synthase 7 n=1 Tax=Morella rubra TaxID=262757 RepID=A0A6A1UP22_9ROSI|nr:Dehydrodolichyl diphosphate synthase 7 [Morella rubra]
MAVRAGDKAGYVALMKILCFCYELGVKYATVYSFSIENFKRSPEEGSAEKAMAATANNNKTVLLICVAYTSYDEIIHAVQESCKVKRSEIEELNSSKASNGVAEGVEEVSKLNGIIAHDVQGPSENSFHKFQALNSNRACNSVKGVENKNGPSVCGIQGFCEDKWVDAASGACNCLNGGVEESTNKQQVLPTIKLLDVEKHMYMSVAPEPDILIRTSGENRLSNFLLWQTTNCPLYSPSALWPELGLWHLVWAVLNYQRSHYYFEKKKKQL